MGARGARSVLLVAAVLAVAGLGPLPARAAAPAPPGHSDAHHGPRAQVRVNKTEPAPAMRLSPRQVPQTAGSLPNAVVGGPWSSLGPQPIADEKIPNGPGVPVSDYGPTSGRVTSLVTDPMNPSTVYLGAAGGGVWKSTDSGATWSATTDSQPSLAIGALGIDAAGTTIYAGTGEDNASADSQYGLGVLKSTDSGATWALTPAGGIGAFAGAHIGGIAVDRTTSGATERVIIASDSGLWISTDSGSTWGMKTFPPGMLGQLSSTPASGDFIQVLQDPNPLRPNRFWAVATDFCQTEVGDVLQSDDSGDTWQNVFRSDWIHAGRITLGLGSDDTAYAAIAAGCGTMNFGNLGGILKTTDGGLSWAPVAGQPPDYMSVAGESQGWYDTALGVDPSDANKAMFGGITALQTLDGGASFADVGQPYSGGVIHPDFHAFAFTGAGTLYAGNDGGVWHSSNLGTSWTNRNGNLNTVQFYAGTSPDASHIVGGTQDNGTPGILPGSPATAPAWQNYMFGDGGYTLLDPTPSSTTIYASTPSGGIWKGSYQPPSSPDPNWPYDRFAEADPCPSGSTATACSQPTAFIAPVLMDPSSPSRLFTATNVVYRTTTGGLPAGSGPGFGWTAISGDLTRSGTPRPDFIATMPTGAAGASTVFSGSYYGALYRSGNATAAVPTWTNIGAGLPTYDPTKKIPGDPWFSGIAFNESNTLEVWVTIGGINLGHVWHTTDGGTTWADISGTGATGVPGSLGVNGVLFDPTAPATVYIATDTGVMVCSTCTGPSAATTAVWSVFGAGLPNVKVNAITQTSGRNQIVAWTHGRGAWILPTAPVLEVKPGQLSFASAPGGGNPPPQNLTVRNAGVGTLTWTAASTTSPPGQPWLLPPNPPSGSDGPGQSTPVQVSVNQAGMAPGSYSGSISFTSNGGSASVSVTLVVSPFPGQYRPLTPARILDTRNGTGGYWSPVGADTTITVAVSGQGMVPKMTDPTPPSAVVLNVTVTNASAASHLIVYPTGTSRPTASNLNFVAGQTVPNLVEVALGPDGKVNIYNLSGHVDVIADVQGWVTTRGTVSGTDGLFRPLVPSRILDTRTGLGGSHTMGPNSTIHLQVSGSGQPPIPPTGANGPEAAVVNVTVTNVSAWSHLIVFPTGAMRPTASNLNYMPGDTRANRVQVKLGTGGQIDIYNLAGTVDVIVDVNGWFTDGSDATATGGKFTGLSPARLLDTRIGTGGPVAPLGPGGTRVLQVSGRGGVPSMSGAVPPTSVVLNVTVTNTSAWSDLIVYPSDAPRPLTSDVNWTAGKTVPNLVVVKLAGNGTITVYNLAGSTDVVIDVSGWYN